MVASQVLLSQFLRSGLQPAFKSALLLLVCSALCADLAHADEAIKNLIKQVKPSVCTIKTNSGTGSGFVIFENAVVTNHHVISDATSVDVIFHDGTKVTTKKSLYIDRLRDIAILAVEGIPATATPVQLFQDAPEQGDTVVAIGHPEGANYSVTRGIVSAIRSANDLMRQFPGEQFSGTWVQTDAAINPGNSGGPLVGLEGEVVGMNSGGHGGAQNLNYAISSMEIHSALKVAEKAQAKRLEGKKWDSKPTIVENPAGANCREPDLEGKPHAAQIALLKAYRKCLKNQTPQLEQSLKNFQAEKENKILNHPRFPTYKKAEAAITGLKRKRAAIKNELARTVKQHTLDVDFALGEILTLGNQRNRAKFNQNLNGAINLIQIENRIKILHLHVKDLRSERTTFSKKKRAELQGIETDIYTCEDKARPLYDFIKQFDKKEDELKKAIKGHKARIRKSDRELDGVERKIKQQDPQHQEKLAGKHMKMLIKFHWQNGLKAARASLEKLIKDFPNTKTAKTAQELLDFEKARTWQNEDKTEEFKAIYKSHNTTDITLLKNGEKFTFKKELLSAHDLKLLKLYFGH